MSRIFNIELVAFTNITQTLFKTTLTMMSKRGYPVKLYNTGDNVDLYLVDSDNTIECEKWRISNPIPKAPIIFIGKNNYGWTEFDLLSKPLKWDILIESIMKSIKKKVPSPPIGWNNQIEEKANIIINPLAKYEKNKILIVDDSVTIRMYIGLKLNDYHVDISHAGSAEEALELIKTNAFKVIFLDVMLPGMDGYEACKKIKKEWRMMTHVVMITSRDSPFDVMRGQISGANDYLIKPIDDNSFHLLMHKLLKK